MTKHNPVHPELIVKRQCIEALNITITGAAEALGISRQQLHRVINGTCAITAEMTLRLSQVFGSSPETWLAMQARYDLAHVKGAEKIHLHRLKAA
jgi:addiction module HigA family antidote